MWKTWNKILLILLFIGSMCACKPLITFEYLEITCSVEERQFYYFEEYIHIYFSHKPDKNDVEKKIRLYEDGSAIMLDYTWNGQAITLRPYFNWQKGQSYSLELQGMLKMDDNRTYTAHLYRSFIYGEDGNSFELILNDLHDDILTFQFSKPVLITSFNERFIITPFAEYNTDFTENNSTIIISPKSGWSSNTTYSWSIKNMISADGYLMKKDFSGLFNGIYDTEQPILEFVCPVDYDISDSLWYTTFELDNNLLEKQAIGFLFSKPMDEAFVVGGVNFSPSISGYFIKETDMRFIFIPNDFYQLQREYRITISDSIKDTSGLPLYEQQYIFFTTANQFLSVSNITFDDNTLMPTDGTIINYSMIPPLLPINPVQLKTTIDFSTNIPQENQNAAVSSISLNVLFPDSANNPTLVSAYWSDGGSRLSIEWSGFTISSSIIENYYMLKVSSGQNGVKNRVNEYLEEDVCVIFIAY